MPKVKHKVFYWIIWGVFLTAAAVFTLLMLLRDSMPVQAPTVPEATGYFRTEKFTLEENGFMTYTGDYTTGIDVSDYQGEIDWQQVKSCGVSFVIIKIGSRGTTEGKLYPDVRAREYYDGAKAAGLQVGAYFFSQAVTPQEAREEAAFALEQIEGWILDFPVAYDWEWGGEESRTTGLDRDTLTQCAQAFCEAIETGGFTPMLYFNESQGLEQMDLERLQSYPFWLAQYDGELTFPHPIAFWQYSQSGTVAGIQGPVDLNICILE